MRKNLKNSIISLLVIISMMAMPLLPFSNTKKASAQIGIGGTGSSVSGYITGLVPVIMKFPGCIKHVREGKIKALFEENFEENKEEIAAALKNYVGIDILGEKATEAASEATSVQTIDPATVNLLIKQGFTLEQIKALSKETKKSVASIDKYANCFDAIGKAVVKILIQKLTLSIVDWINGTNRDGPLFLTKPDKFFKDIAENEILGFRLEISDPDKFPFGKAFMMNEARKFSQRFADNAQYSLNEMISQTTPEYTAASFSSDFSMGGWNAWDALTQVPYNNPLGFQIEASNELGKRLEGTEKSVANLYSEALQQAGGYLGDERCADPKNLSREKHKAALVKGEKDAEGNIIGTCKRWEYVTPGKLIGERLTDAVGYNDHALLDAKTLNDAIASILDAVIARFSSELTDKGLLALSEIDNNDEELFNNTELGNYFNEGSSTNQVELDFPSSYMTTWLAQNPNFNIRTDVTQALVDEQKTYINKLAVQNKELGSSTNLSNIDTKNYGLIPTIYQLDYCIPGPHPGWEEDSRMILNVAENAIPSKTKEDMKGYSGNEIAKMAGAAAPAIGAAVGGAVLTGAVLGSAIPGLGTVIGAAAGLVVGLLIPVIENWISGGDADTKLNGYYAIIFAQFTGVRELTEGNTEKVKHPMSLSSKGDVINALDTIFERYILIINDVFKDELKPRVYKEAETEFNKLKGYGQIVKNNDKKIASMEGITIRLLAIKDDIDKLNIQLAKNLLTLADGNTTQEDQYEAELKPHINSFAILSSELASGDDIAEVDSITKQIIDKKNYVYNVLLKGPDGCEKDLEEGKPNGGLPWQVYDTKRMEPPGPFLYDYNILHKGDPIPDPFNSGYENHMKGNTDINNVGPGFLSHFYFATPGTFRDPSCDLNPGNFSCPLMLIDLIRMNTWNATIGKVPEPEGEADFSYQGPFEKMIYVY